MSLNNGSLRAYLPSGFWMTNATAPRSGSPLGWVSSTLYSRPAETVFSVVHAPAGRLPMLAGYGREDLWSLCPFQGFRGQTSIVYDVEKDDGIPPSSIGFDVRDCYAVEIYVIADIPSLDCKIQRSGSRTLFSARGSSGVCPKTPVQ